MARPVGTVGDVRGLLGMAARQLADERGGATWREIYQAAAVVNVPVGRGAALAGECVQRGLPVRVARDTIKNMVKAGELRPVGSSKAAGSARWMALYAPAERQTAIGKAAPALDAVLRGWVRGGAM